MKALIQRVQTASVLIKKYQDKPLALPSPTRGEGRSESVKIEIGHGLVVFLGVGINDTPEKTKKLAEKVATLRIFSNEEGKFDKSILDVQGECLVVSQFTLYGNTSKGRRPDFTRAAAPQTALPLYKYFLQELRFQGVKTVEEGEFQAHMEVTLTNDGPVTILLEA